MEPSDSQAQIQSTPPKADPEMVRRILLARCKAGASWYYWIAGLSAVNTVLIYTKAHIAMLGGLGVTQLADALAQYSHSTTFQSITFGLDIFLALIYVIIGMYASKASRGAYIVGMVLYALDALVYLPFLAAGTWVDLAFHGYVMFRLFNGLKSGLALEKFEAVVKGAAL